MNTREESEKKRYSHCNNIQEREDVIFVYPIEFNNDPNMIANAMQKVMNFLKEITGLGPTTFFSQRVMVGYRHQNDEGGHKTKPIWTQNRISIPWKYLKMPNQPLDVCTHELVHPFFRCSPLHDRNEGWGEGFCEFLRGPLKKIVGLDGDNWWKKMIKAAQDKVDSSYSYPAGQFVLKAYENYKSADGSRTISDLISDHDAISSYVKSIFSRFEKISLSTYIEPSPKMIKKWKDKNKI